MRSLIGLASGSLMAIGAALGCDKTDAVGEKCAVLTVPGVVVAPVGIDVALRNREGQPIAAHADLTATGASETPASGFPEDSLTLAVYVYGGTYAVHVSEPYYRDTTLSNVVVVSSDCGTVRTTKLAVILETVAGAPPVRSVSVFGREFLAAAGASAALVAIVDADANQSSFVTWRSSDTTLATVSASGIVKAKCSVHGGSDTVTATSVADPTVMGFTTMGIGASGSC